MDDYIRDRAMVCGLSLRGGKYRFRILPGQYMDDIYTDRQIPVCDGCRDCEGCFDPDHRGIALLSIDMLFGEEPDCTYPTKWPDKYGWIG